MYKGIENILNENINNLFLNGNIEHYYCIASKDSLVSSDEYLKFLDKHDLDYEIVDTIKNTDLTIKVSEELFDSQVLKV